jgi:hypothetical protein
MVGVPWQLDNIMLTLEGHGLMLQAIVSTICLALQLRLMVPEVEQLQLGLPSS